MAPDSRGVYRGRCKTCKECDEFVLESDSIKCAYCGHSPGQHELIQGSQHELIPERNASKRKILISV